ncbi:hypothetical protein BCh11DRAFT_05628 [Burkholderia sp. Ch1-1]|nr:hypothetical protein BCh11DRAFT_05628 [Burkholderia sp. Ch1-1]
MSENVDQQDVITHGIKRVRKITREQYEKRVAAEKVRLLRKRKSARDASPLPIVVALRAAAEQNTPESAKEYFRLFSGQRTVSLRGADWLKNPRPYLGREHVDVVRLSRGWLPLILEWLENRSARGFETSKGQRSAALMLCDYLFNYLPWWIELNPGTDITVPMAPKDFSRFLFVARTEYTSEQLEPDGRALPATFLELVALRRLTPDTFNTTIVTVERFFQFVIAAYSEVPEVAGPKMVNPIRLFFDKRKSSRPSKTNKVPFDEHVFPHLVHFTQAVEAFGEFLQQRAYENDAFANLANERIMGYESEEWGYVPFICHRGSVYPLKWIPNVFHIPRRSFHMNPQGTAGIYVTGRKINGGLNVSRLIKMPHLTVLRMLMGLVETGLRAQGMQWLDRIKWDSANPRPRPIAELYTSVVPEMFTKLYVNTDKSKDKPWTTYIPWRLRRTLLAEQYFQESLNDKKLGRAVAYEGRTNSRFEPVVPLFMSNLQPTPYSDKTYSVYWRDLLGGFQIYYNSRIAYSSRYPQGRAITQDEPSEFLVLTPRYEEDGETPSEEIGDDDSKYCPFTWVAVSSPHACRATYATLRDGEMEVSEIAQQLGHASEITTSIYQVPSEERLRAKLERSELRRMGYDPEGKSEAFTHPEARDGVLRKAFAENRDATIESFGFVNGVMFWSTSELDDGPDALALLRESPASVIKWHATHVCPVGNQCPSDIVPKIGGLQWCGLCPLAAKSVDHLPAIAAKKNELKERIRLSARKLAKLEGQEDTSELIDHLHRHMGIDAKELMGWELSQQILHDQAERLEGSGARYHAHAPELIRLHLQHIVRNRSESEFFLQRICEANAYPSMESPEVRARAAKFIRLILARAGRLEDAATLDIEPFEELKAFASLVKPMAEAKGFGLEEVAKALEPTPRQPVLRVDRPVLLEGSPAEEA